jgi:hypothetical protein
MGRHIIPVNATDGEFDVQVPSTLGQFTENLTDVSRF